jgi:hypothetical protein
MSFWANVFWANVFLAIVFLGNYLSGKMSFWENVFWANVFLGKCLSGQMFFWTNVLLSKCLWANFVWANVIEPGHAGQRLYITSCDLPRFQKTLIESNLKSIIFTHARK